MGHSHAQCAYNDDLIEGTENLAQAGEAYFYTYIKMKKILEENDRIEAVFLEYSNNQINTNMREWTLGDEYLYNKYPKYASFMSFNELWFLFSGNFKAVINAQSKTLFKNLKFILKGEKDIVLGMNWGGYLKLKRDDAAKDAEQLNIATPQDGLPVSQLNIFYLEKIIQLASLENIKLILVRSPLHEKYQELKNEPQFQEIRKTKFTDIPFLDFKNYTLKDSEFGDLEHLNYKGANKFSLFFNIHLDSKNLELKKFKNYLVESKSDSI